MEGATDLVNANGAGEADECAHRLEMRSMASITQTGRNRIVPLIVLLILSGCQVVAHMGETTPPCNTATAEPVSVPPTPPATVESETVAQTETRPTKRTERKDSVTITVVYDNNPYDPQLQTAWGFGCLVETPEATLLFDTGGDGTALLGNMETLGIEPQSIETVVLSHFHGDHTGGLESLLATGVRPTVYVPRSFPADFKSRVRVDTDLVEVHRATEIIDGIYTTGEMGSGLIEQALMLNTASGLVIVTGCAHPGITEMIHRAKEIGGDNIYLALGGFHLGKASEGRIREIIADFRRLGVQKVAPCHCTGDRAIALFLEAYGEDFIQNGVGQVIEIMNER